MESNKVFFVAQLFCCFDTVVVLTLAPEVAGFSCWLFFSSGWWSGLTLEAETTSYKMLVPVG